MSMIRCFALVAVLCAAFAVATGRSLSSSGSMMMMSPPTYAPAPAMMVNGACAYTCSSPGSMGYMYGNMMCKYGMWYGMTPYCDMSVDGMGYVGIRMAAKGNCTANSMCPQGWFCDVQQSLMKTMSNGMMNGTCVPFADMYCFSGAPAPGTAMTPMSDMMACDSMNMMMMPPTTAGK